GQQFYVIRRNPAPGTPAYDAMEARKRENNLRHGRPAEAGLKGAEAATETVQDERPAQRQQPKRQSRSDRKTGPGAAATPVTDTSASANGQTTSSAPQDAPKKTQAGAAKKQPAAKKGTAAKRQPAAKSAAQKKAAQKKTRGSR